MLRGRFTPGETGARMVRPDAARAHPSLHAEPAARGNRAGQPGRLHALPVRAGSTSSRRRRLTGLDGLRAVVAQLDGFELPAGAWERAVLPARLDGYEPSMLDMLCLAGEVGWARLSPCRPASEPGAAAWCRRRRSRCSCASTRTRGGRCATTDERAARSAETARHVLSVLRSRGASFFRDLAIGVRARRRPAAAAIGALVACGLVDVRWIRRAARARVGGARASGTARSAQQLRRPLVGDRGNRRRRDARRRGRAAGVDAAPPLRRRVPAAADPRDERGAVARARARLPAARGARRDPRRPVRHRHVGRAVRAAATRSSGCARSGARRPTAVSSRSAPPIR